jgi:response regulator NasT
MHAGQSSARVHGVAGGGQDIVSSLAWACPFNAPRDARLTHPDGTILASFRCMPDADLKVLIVDQNLMRASVLEAGLREAGYREIVVVRDMQNLLRRIDDAAPDVILIDLENPNRDVLEQMFQMSRVIARPVAMFVDQSDSSMIERAIESGVSAYVVDGLRKERVKAIVDTAISRYRAFSRLREELDRAKQQLEDRKLIERAKGILMKQKGLTEAEAYAQMRTAAMRDNLRLSQVAQAIITAARLLE